MDKLSKIVPIVRIRTLSLELCNVRNAGVQATKELVRTPAPGLSTGCPQGRLSTASPLWITCPFGLGSADPPDSGLAPAVGLPAVRVNRGDPEHRFPKLI